MKCPKCGYIGFEQADKCRHCGYDFSLATDPAIDFDLSLKPDVPLSAPADFEFRTGDTPPPVEPASTHDPDFDLPTPPSPPAELPLFQAPSSGHASALDATRVPRPRPASRTPPGPIPAAARPPQADAPIGTPANSRPTPSRERAPMPRRSVPAPVRPRAVASTFDFHQAEADPEEIAVPRPTRARATTTADRSAGSLARASAGIVDALILLGLDAAVLYFTLRVCRLAYADILRVPLAPLVAFFLLLDGGYLVAFTAVGGQTIGKMAASLKVVSEEGGRVVAGQAFVRAIAYFATALFAGLGFVPGLFGPSRRALHDRLANTRVVRL